MAIKGKKKAGSRGSQARRRPAAAPRPVVTTRRKDPWYSTATGRVVAALLVALLIAGIAGAVVWNRNNANEKKEKLEALEDYVDDVEAIVTGTGSATAALSQITPTAPAEQLETLREEAPGWIDSYETATGDISGLTPPEEAAPINAFFMQSFQLYTTAARMLSDASELEGKAQANLLTRASEVRGQAEGNWIAAVAVLDEEFAALGESPSGLESPGTAAASTAPVAPPEGDGGGGGGG